MSENTNNANNKELTFEDVLGFLQSNSESEEVKSYTETNVKKYLDSERGKLYLQPKLDSFFSKGLESWKAKTLPSIIDEEILKRNPTETPEQKRIRELEEKLNRQELNTQRNAIKATSMKVLNSKGMPTSFADYLTFDTEAGARNAINNLELEWTVALDKAVTERLKTNGKNPKGQENAGFDPKGMTREKLLKMPLKESTDFYNNNPDLWRTIMNSEN